MTPIPPLPLTSVQSSAPGTAGVSGTSPSTYIPQRLPKSRRRDAFIHVVTVVFGLDTNTDDNPVYQAFVHDSSDADLDIYHLITIPHDEIADLEWKAGRSLRPLAKGYQTIIHAFQSYYNTEFSIDPSFDPQDLLSLTYELFDEYQSRYPHILASQAQAPLPAPPSSHGTSPYNAITEYHRGIKRDPTVYEPIRDISQWTWWKRSFEATADAQGVTNVLDWNYSPRTTEDATLLEEQSKYVYSVLLKVIKAALLHSILSKFDSTTVREAWRTINHCRDQGS